ncbi:MAG: heavy metal translocating P-type ATPase metal-binding domain-containing protein [Chitinophagales bacterium]|jgi:Cu+-exporting ATPase|nr:heavy metal translocating P-type ATPase metal-binding domain-containing protein [Chitinophagales bacterium]
MISDVCYHCQRLSKAQILFDEKYFCCQGCISVYQILKQHDLCSFYEFEDKSRIIPEEQSRLDRFAYLDHPDIQAKLISFKDTTTTWVRFYVPKIHCSSCLWLISHLHRINPNVVSSQVNFPKKEVLIKFITDKITLREVVELMSSVGYEPLISQHKYSEDQRYILDKEIYYALGISGFVFANVMTYSFADYASFSGVSQVLLAKTFSYLSVFLASVSLIFAARPFYVSAYTALRHRYINIDFPVVLALLVTYLRSIYEIFLYKGSGYLDSMTGVIFFLLVGRWLKNRTYQYISFDRDFRSFFPMSAIRMTEKGEEAIPVEQINPKDRLILYSGDVLPVDAILSRGPALIDYSFVNGESQPNAIEIGGLIYAGGKEIKSQIEVIATESFTNSRMNYLWTQSKTEATQTQDKLDILANWLTYFVVGLGLISFLYWWNKGEIYRGFSALTSVLIVACPCALLLAHYFAHGYVLMRLSRLKIFFRNDQILERLTQIRQIAFDKTGTLTQTYAETLSYRGEELDEATLLAVKSICRRSKHILSQSIVSYLSYISGEMSVIDFVEHPSLGLEATIGGHRYKIGSARFMDIEEKGKQTRVYIAKNGNLLGNFEFLVDFREGIPELLRHLRPKYAIWLISGDHDGSAQAFSPYFEASHMHFFQSIEDKKKKIQDLNAQFKTAMIGDGLNDAAAFEQSHVAIAVSENAHFFTPAADIILSSDALKSLDKLIEIALTTKKIVYLCFVISLIYNVIGLYYALSGTLKPVIAAILMPMSTLTIVLITYFGVKWMFRFWK